MVEGQRLTFDVWGLDRDVFIMRDRETGTIWSHLDGTAVQGPLEGARIAMVPLPLVVWSEWTDAYPHTLVLSPDTPFSDRYRLVRLGRFNRSEARYGDDRLPSNALVVGVEEGDAFMSYPLDTVQGVGGVVNDEVNGRPVVVRYNSVTHTGIAYFRMADDTVVEFYNAAPEGFELRDYGTDTLWDTQGRAVEGPLAGARLDFVPSFISEWYGWSAYYPETGLYEAAH